ncbi:putative X-ray repair cross complementing 2 (XRCC2) [Tripterygium wilfordii]|uniref:Putative X-ray repair cross complementing 2 (XRCC2) n=1 Tax=Tripterygium wilfordii TaxID=458696 RepID=A0A7J7CUR1_TRIWF|nr:DNA repair protein XRCC2 homolog [Tripterygium wilfordii]KAF5737803.1 putative X-ray repair cross complementing 2 (XRCC2) [Tripterygium wilfordii]
MAAQRWIDGDESAKEMLSRVLKERPFLLLPPLHRIPLRVGNVVELVGSSPSAKTHILIQAAITCILPTEWNGVHYGGLGRLVVFIDLDCRFDVPRLAEMLKHRIVEATESHMEERQKNDVDMRKGDSERRPSTAYNDQLFAICMRRFLYIRCYDSFEYLATLKTLHHMFQKEKEAQGVGVHFLMIDGIGALHWVDRNLTSLPLGVNSRKSLSLQNLWETVVMEITRLLMVHPMLVFATKATIVGDKFSATEAKRTPKNWSSPDIISNSRRLLYREYMPSVWQSFVTHRIIVQAKDDHLFLHEHQNQPIFSLEWLFPPLSFVDKFIVKDAGVFIVP